MGKVLAEQDSSSRGKALKDFSRRANYYWGILHPAFEKIRKLTRGDIAEITALLSDVRPWRIEDRFERGVRNLTQRAIYTFVVDIQDQPENEQAVLVGVMEKFIHDAKLAVRDVLRDVLFEIIGTPFRREVDPQISEAIKPIESIVDQIPEPVKGIMDLKGMIDEIIENVLYGCIDAALTPHSEPMLGKLDALPGKLGFGSA